MNDHSSPTYGGLILLILFGVLVSVFFVMFSAAGRKRPHFRAIPAFQYVARPDGARDRIRARSPRLDRHRRHQRR